MNLPKITIVTPSYNQGKFIEETILSVLNQNYPNLEYMIIDGGSTDNSIDIIKKHEKELSYWVSEKDQGQSHAINKGFTLASGEIIGWLNSDDILLPHALFRIAHYFQADNNLDFINGNLILIDENSKIIDNHLILNHKDWYAKRGISYISQPSMFWKRKVFKDIGFLREDFQASMDREFIIRILRNNFKLKHINEFFAGFRIHGESKSAAGWSNKHYIRDLQELQTMYGNNYGNRPKLRFKIVYGLEKLIRGIYIKKLAFNLKWKGKNIKDLPSLHSRLN